MPIGLPCRDLGSVEAAIHEWNWGYKISPKNRRRLQLRRTDAQLAKRACDRRGRMG